MVHLSEGMFSDIAANIKYRKLLLLVVVVGRGGGVGRGVGGAGYSLHEEVPVIFQFI